VLLLGAHALIRRAVPYVNVRSCAATDAAAEVNIHAALDIRPDSVAEVNTYESIVQYVYAEVDPQR
jgi:hypothetical protein